MSDLINQNKVAIKLYKKSYKIRLSLGKSYLCNFKNIITIF